jgi:hypothetical protein
MAVGLILFGQSNHGTTRRYMNRIRVAQSHGVIFKLIESRNIEIRDFLRDVIPIDR